MKVVLMQSRRQFFVNGLVKEEETLYDNGSAFVTSVWGQGHKLLWWFRGRNLGLKVKKQTDIIKRYFKAIRSSVAGAAKAEPHSSDVEKNCQSNCLWFS